MRIVTHTFCESVRFRLSRHYHSRFIAIDQSSRNLLKVTSNLIERLELIKITLASKQGLEERHFYLIIRWGVQSSVNGAALYGLDN